MTNHKNKEDDQDQPKVNTKWPVVSETKGVYMRKSGEPIMVGTAVVQKYQNYAEVVMTIDNEDAQESAILMLSPSTHSLSLGIILDPEVAKAVAAARN